MQNCTWRARSGVMPKVATSTSTLPVSRYGMRFGPVTGTSSQFDAEILGHQLRDIDIVAFVLVLGVHHAERRQIDQDADLASSSCSARHRWSGPRPGRRTKRGGGQPGEAKRGERSAGKSAQTCDVSCDRM